MDGGAYRDPLAGLRAKRAVVDALLTQTNALVWMTCTSSELGEIERFRALAFADDGAAANDAAVTLGAMLETFISRASERLASGAVVEDEGGPLELWELEDSALDAFRERLGRALAPWTVTSRVERFDNRRLVTRFSAGAVPFALTVRVSDRREGVDTASGLPDMKIGDYSSVLRTTAPACLPELALQTERAWHTAQRAIGLAREPQLGDPRFDEAFWVRGDERLARALLVPNVREELYYLSHRTPGLSMKDGTLTVEWSGRWGTIAPDDLASGLSAAVSAVVGIRGEIERARVGR